MSIHSVIGALGGFFIALVAVSLLACIVFAAFERKEWGEKWMMRTGWLAMLSLVLSLIFILLSGAYSKHEQDEAGGEVSLLCDDNILVSNVAHYDPPRVASTLIAGKAIIHTPAKPYWDVFVKQEDSTPIRLRFNDCSVVTTENHRQ